MPNGDITTNDIMEFLQENMVTKDDLVRDLNKQKQEILDCMDDKLSDMKGDLVVLMRKEDYKVIELINVLKNKDVLSAAEATKLLAMQPFPQSLS